jgi:hypothetical protein
MKQRLIVFVVIAALAAGVSVYSCSRKPSRQSRDKLVEQFVKILPDSLDAAHIAEIRKLFYTMWERDKLGKVKPETITETTDELASWVQKGHINQKQLIRFMAQVGYNTYKDDKKYTLPDGSNDNPILNPNSSRVSLQFDSTQYDSAFWADFKKWKKEHPAQVDSILRANDSLMPPTLLPPHKPKQHK